MSWSSCCWLTLSATLSLIARSRAIVDLGQLELGLVEVDQPRRLVELRLIRPGVDLEEEVARLDVRPLLERDLDEVAGDPGEDVDRLDGVGPAGEFHGVGDLTLDGQADRDGHRFRRRDLGRLSRASDRRGQRADNERDQEARTHAQAPRPSGRLRFERNPTLIVPTSAANLVECRISARTASQVPILRSRNARHESLGTQGDPFLKPGEFQKLGSSEGGPRRARPHPPFFEIP